MNAKTAMLLWVLFFITTIISLLCSYGQGALPVGDLFLFGIYMFMGFCASSLIYTLLSLFWPNGPKVVKDRDYYPIYMIEDDKVVYHKPNDMYGSFIKDKYITVIDDAISHPYVEKITYREGGFKGYWLISLADYPAEYIIHELGQNSSKTT